MEIQLRAYEKQDSRPLEDIIRETWNYDRFASSKTAKKLARAFLTSCLTNYTFSQVAVLDGEPVGIILVNDIEKHHCKIGDRFRQIQALLSLYFSGEGRKTMKIFESVNGIDKKLLKKTQKTYPAELALFAVASKCRGKGIGKNLFQSALAYMEQQGLKEFYLFTDTSCNYRFYEHQGMVRRCEMEHVFELAGQKVRMQFFIYDYRKNA